MALHRKNYERDKNIVRLDRVIARQVDTLAMLKAEGRSCPDAQRQLDELKDALALLR